MMPHSVIIVWKCAGPIVYVGTLALGGLARAQEPPALGSRHEGVHVADTLAPCVFEGFVYAPDGAPAEGAVVVTSAGGRAVADASGRYRLEAPVPPDAERVQVTAVGGGGRNQATASVAVSATSGTVSVGPLSLVQGGVCSPRWLPTFGGQPGTDSEVKALVVYDDGSGPALYAGGFFTSAGGALAQHVAKWDGSSWSALGSGLPDSVYALAVYDDGGGPALYAGGSFSIAKWDGSSWTTPGGGVANFGVGALAVFDDGSGAALYAAGSSDIYQPPPPSGLMKWDGSSWTPMGQVGGITEFAVYDDGGGPALYAGGVFTTIGGVPANRIAKWDGASWSALGSGTNEGVFALAVYDDGGGPALYAGGHFSRAGGVAGTNHIARWDGASWSALDSGTNEDVFALAVYDDGGGPALYAGGEFVLAGGGAASRIARWDGSSWAMLGSGVSDAPGHTTVEALAVYDDGGGGDLYVGGDFTKAGGGVASYVARWEGSSWTALGSGIDASNNSPPESVNALATYDDGLGTALYAAGDFLTTGSLAANRIARWDGSSWTALGSGMNDSVGALAVHDDGSGPALYAGGRFTTAGNLVASHIARWDGSSWTALGSGVPSEVRALAVYDDGGGSDLYAGGDFVNRIARWNGSSWSQLGSGMSNRVSALAVYDDGGGPALYAGGGFLYVGALTANYIAKWDGSSWTALGSGMSSEVRALVVYDDGGGPALYAGGRFATAGGLAANYIARWDGSSWTALGSGMNSWVEALTVHDDGSGPALYAGGQFSSAGGVAAKRIAKWAGSSWTTLGSGMSGAPFGVPVVRALVSFDHGGGPALFAGGYFGSAPDSGDSHLAKWAGCDTTPPVISCPPPILAPDRFLDGQEVVNFTVTASDHFGAAPVVVCVPPSGSLFPLGTTLVTCTATDASGNQSTCQFSVTVQQKVRRR